MRQTNLDALLLRKLPIACSASEAVMAVYEAGKIDAQPKVDSSFVTEADSAANELLAGCPVVSEEGEASQIHRRGDTRFWLIDPLNGTKECIARNGELMVNVALIEEGRSVLGVVYAPAIDALYWGVLSVGAFRTARVESSLIKVGDNGVAGVFCVVASKNHLNAETQSFIDQLGPLSLVQAGSSLKFCRVAEGEADFIHALRPPVNGIQRPHRPSWMGAGGGAVLDLYSQSLWYEKLDVLNPSFIATLDVALIYV